MGYYIEIPWKLTGKKFRKSHRKVTVAGTVEIRSRQRKDILEVEPYQHVAELEKKWLLTFTFAINVIVRPFFTQTVGNIQALSLETPLSIFQSDR